LPRISQCARFGHTAHNKAAICAGSAGPVTDQLYTDGPT
jgi:hypothetical protein